MRDLPPKKSLHYVCAKLKLIHQSLLRALIVLIMVQPWIKGRIHRLNSRLVGHVVDVGRYTQLGVDPACLELFNNTGFIRECARPAKRTTRRTSARSSIKIALPSKTWSCLYYSQLKSIENFLENCAY